MIHFPLLSNADEQQQITREPPAVLHAVHNFHHMEKQEPTRARHP
jgi:hypothetical protein